MRAYNLNTYTQTYGVDETQLPQHREAVVTGKYSLTLKHCFDLFTKQEELDANDTWYVRINELIKLCI